MDAPVDAQILPLQDKDRGSEHDRFMAWRRQNPQAFYLAVKSKQRANLHSAKCSHQGDYMYGEHPEWGSATKSLKVCADTQGRLQKWAQSQGISISPCQDCLKTLKKAPSGGAAGTSTANASAPPPVGAVEGARRERMHSRLERDSALIERAKKAWLKQDPTLACFVCGFSFLRRYGISFIEAHHRIPLATPNVGPRRTTLADLVGVCANCHRTLHREQNLSPENLRDRLSGGHNRQSRKRT